MEFQTRFNNWVKPRQVFDPESSLTFQSMKDETDINLIIKNYKATGKLPSIKGDPMTVRYPQFGDFTQITDYADAVQALNLAKEAFSELPSAVRRRFDNDPAKLVSFIDDPANMQEAVDLGLIEKPISVDPSQKPTDGGNITAGDVAKEVGTGASA